MKSFAESNGPYAAASATSARSTREPPARPASPAPSAKARHAVGRPRRRELPPPLGAGARPRARRPGASPEHPEEQNGEQRRADAELVVHRRRELDPRDAALLDHDSLRAARDRRERCEADRDEPGQEPGEHRHERRTQTTATVPTTPPASAARTTPASTAPSVGQPAFVSSTAVAKAPRAMNAPWPSEGIPPSPTTIPRPTAAAAR